MDSTSKSFVLRKVGIFRSAKGELLNGFCSPHRVVIGQPMSFLKYATGEAERVLRIQVLGKLEQFVESCRFAAQYVFGLLDKFRDVVFHRRVSHPARGRL
ncbi:MAG TPA: hypothetical protein VHC22_10255 [Pirellulales bacterium]|nr:hypothetical protein [Pirellulales bacterium]